MRRDEPPIPARSIEPAFMLSRSEPVVREPREAYRLRGQHFHLNTHQVRALRDVGAFRVVDVDDLVRHIYAGERAHAWCDLRQLERQGLLALLNPRSRRGAASGRHYYAGLTKAGRQLTQRLQDKPGQRLWIGGKKVREMRHDAALYRVFQQTRDELEGDGSRVLRVVLDTELKRAMNRDLGEAKRTEGDERRGRLDALAARHHLRVVGDTIPLPDLRIEYETPDGRLERRDVEYLTENYRAASIAQKAAAGFQLVAAAGARGAVARATTGGDRTTSRRRPDDDSLAERMA